MRFIHNRNTVRLYNYDTLYENVPFFEVDGPKYVIESLNESSDKQILNEALGKGLAKDAIQLAISGAAEYGLLSSIGGAPAAPAVETVIDSIFAADSVAGVVSIAKDAASQVGEYAALLNDVMNSSDNCVENPKQFYRNVKRIVKIALKVLGKKATTKVEELAKKIQAKVNNLIDKVVDALVEGIKMLIPDATAGAAVSAAIRTALSKSTENSYDLLTGVINKTGSFKEYLTNPEKITKFVDETAEKIAEICEKFSENIKSTSTLKSAMKGLRAGVAGAAAGVAIKKLGPEGFKKLANFIREKKKDVSDLINTMIKVVIPVAYSVFAIFQILMKNEYKEEVKEKKTKVESYKKSVNRKQQRLFEDNRWQKLAGITK